MLCTYQELCNQNIKCQSIGCVQEGVDTETYEYCNQNVIVKVLATVPPLRGGRLVKAMVPPSRGGRFRNLCIWLCFEHYGAEFEA